MTEKRNAIFIAVFTIIVHLIFIQFPTVNQEFAFIDAAEYFKSLKQIQLEQYFSFQANTLGLPYFIHLISYVFPHADLVILFRIVNLIGLSLFMIGLYRISHYLAIKNRTIILLLIILNPLVWTFSGRATADILPAAIGFFAISLAIGEKRVVLRSLVAGILLGFSVILKYHALSLLIFLGGLLLLKDGRNSIVIKLAIVATITLAILGFYLFKVHSIFGFWLTPDKFKKIHHITIPDLINNLILYIGFLGLLTLPTFFLSKEFYGSMRGKWKQILCFLAVLVFLGLYGLHDGGELNFGPLDLFLGDKVRVLILSLMCIATLVLIFTFEEQNPEDKKLKLVLGFGILLVLLVFSSSRPAQRYLLFVLPFFTMVIPDRILKSKIVVITTLGIFILANSFIESSRWSTGMAAKLMVEKLEAASLIQQTDPGVIEGHVGNKFFETRDLSKRYTIIAGKSDVSVITTTAGRSVFQKKFSLVEIRQEKL